MLCLMMGRDKCQAWSYSGCKFSVSVHLIEIFNLYYYIVDITSKSNKQGCRFTSNPRNVVDANRLESAVAGFPYRENSECPIQYNSESMKIGDAVLLNIKIGFYFSNVEGLTLGDGIDDVFSESLFDYIY